MKDLGDGIYALLNEVAAVNTLVAGRIRPNLLAQDEAYPAIRYVTISTTPVRSHKGISNLIRNRVQIDCYAETAGGAAALANAVRGGIDNFKGVRGGVALEGVLFEDQQPMFEDTINKHRESMDFFVWWRPN